LQIDPEYLGRLGISEQFPGWQETAKASVGELHVKSWTDRRQEFTF